MLKVDNRVVGQTGWGPVSKQSWDQNFVVPLERVRMALVRPGVGLGYGVEGWPGRADAMLHPQSALPDVGPRAGDWGALAGLEAAMWRGLPAAGGLPGQCLSPALPQPGATGTAFCPGAHWPLPSDLMGPGSIRAKRACENVTCLHRGMEIVARGEEVSKDGFASCGYISEDFMGV